VLADSEPSANAAAPDPRYGPPFGALRTDAFRLEPGTQGVLLSFGAAGAATIDEELAEIGLSTRGASPALDHLVKDELLARTLSIASRCYLRDELGRALAGQSLRVTFATSAPAEGAGKAWNVRLAGDDPGAAGRSWPDEGRSEVYTRKLLYWVRGHALKPPLAPADLALLDGTHRFGRDPELDRRSELVRALIQSYAGSLGLTSAHEVGHLFGLDHEREDPTGIMFGGEEQGGVKPEEAHFTETELAQLRRSPGVAK